jgi:hypothetical protein
LVNGVLAAVVLTGICRPGLTGEDAASAHRAQSQAQVRAQRDALSRKLQLLDRLLRESPAAARIEQSDDTEAQRLLAEARDAHREATRRYQAGDLAEAETQIDDGLMAMTDASRRVTDTRYQAQQQRKRYESLSERVTTFLEAFHRVVAEKQGEPVAGLLDEESVSRETAQAAALAEQGDYASANKRLKLVAAAIEVALSEARREETLLHELKFDSPEQEYTYEKQRNQAYKLLIDLLQSKQSVSETALAHMKSMVLQNEQLRSEADALARSGDTKAAIAKLEKGTESLARALRASGLVF